MTGSEAFATNRRLTAGVDSVQAEAIAREIVSARSADEVRPVWSSAAVDRQLVRIGWLTAMIVGWATILLVTVILK